MTHCDSNIKKPEKVLNSPLITNLSTMLLHSGVNNINEQYSEVVAINLKVLTEAY